MKTLLITLSLFTATQSQAATQWLHSNLLVRTVKTNPNGVAVKDYHLRYSETSSLEHGTLAANDEGYSFSCKLSHAKNVLILKAINEQGTVVKAVSVLIAPNAEAAMSLESSRLMFSCAMSENRV